MGGLHGRRAPALAVGVLCFISLAWVRGAEKKFDGGTGGTSSAWATSTSWNADGLPSSTDFITLDNTFVASLPSAMSLSAKSFGPGDRHQHE